MEHQRRRHVTGAFLTLSARKRGEQKGLDTLVVHAVNDACWLFRVSTLFRAEANALSQPPGEYGRKTKTQRNRRGLAQAVEHEV